MSVPPAEEAPPDPVSHSGLPAHTPADLCAAHLQDPDIATALQWFTSSNLRRPTLSPAAVDLCTAMRLKSLHSFFECPLPPPQMISHQSSWLFPPLCWMTASPLCILCLLVAISSSSRLYSKCRQRFSWPGQSSIVRLFIQACDECAMSQKTASRPVTNVLCPRRLRPSL